jgi:hypothetical protein
MWSPRTDAEAWAIVATDGITTASDPRKATVASNGSGGCGNNAGVFERTQSWCLQMKKPLLRTACRELRGKKVWTVLNCEDL